jgi:hypothetical protein
MKFIGRFLLGLVVLVLIAAAADPSPYQYRKHGSIALNNLHVTPCHVDIALTKEDLCSKEFHTRDERSVSEATKVAVCQSYGQMTGCPGHAYEIDHLVSIELGGAEDSANLWPQPAPDFRVKDIVENKAHHAVCAGQITLQDAQQRIASDWYQFALDEGWVK